MLADIEEAIRVTRESVHAASTSDLHIEGNEPPWHRVDGAMQRMDLPVTEPESVRAFCEMYLSKKEGGGGGERKGGGRLLQQTDVIWKLAEQEGNREG